MNRSAFLESFIAAALTLSVTLPARSVGAKGSKPEAEAMVAKAISYIKANGADKAFTEFTTGTSFKDRDLYVIVYDLRGRTSPMAPMPNWSAGT